MRVLSSTIASLAALTLVAGGAPDGSKSGYEVMRPGAMPKNGSHAGSMDVHLSVDRDHQGDRQHMRGSGSGAPGHDVGHNKHGGSWDGSGSFAGREKNHKKRHHCGPPRPRHNGSHDGSHESLRDGSFAHIGCDESNSASGSSGDVGSVTVPTASSATKTSTRIAAAATALVMAAAYLLA